MKNLSRLSIVFGVALFVSGCATLAPHAQSVKLVDPAELSKMDDCKEVGKITESSEMGRENLVILLKNKTADYGGNVLVTKMNGEKEMGFFTAATRTQGKAFACNEGTLTKLHGAEDF